MIGLLNCDNSVSCCLSIVTQYGVTMVAGLGPGDLSGTMQGREQDKGL